MDLSFKEFELQGWEKIADDYHKCFGPITSQSATYLVKNANIKRNDKVLDIACGPGYVAALASNEGGMVTGIDFSKSMIQLAKNRHPNIDFRVMDAEDIQFDHAAFDIVLMNFGILHLANPEKAIQEACRVLKPNGKFLFTVWHKPNKSKTFDLIMNAVKEEGEINISIPEGPDVLKFREPSIGMEILLNCGFSNIEAKSIEFIWSLNNAEELFEAFYKGGIRIGAILRAQKPDALQRITKNLKQNAKAFQKDGRLEIPMFVLLYFAKKPSQGSSFEHSR